MSPSTVVRGAAILAILSASDARADPVLARCRADWTHCGLDANAPDQFFGGCLSNAGTLCVPR